MISPFKRQQTAHVLEIVLVLTVVSGVAMGLTLLADFFQGGTQHRWLGQVVRVVAMYLFFVAAVIFCASLTIFGIRLIRNMANRDDA